MAKPKKTYPHCNAINKYARNVRDGKVVACKWVKLAAIRHLKDIEESKKNKNSKFEWDRDKAERFCNFFEKMIHVKGEWAKAGATIKMEPFQAFSFGVPFGWVHRKSRLRKYREVFLMFPRKSAKSTGGAIVGNYLFFADGEEGAEVYSGANSERQALKVFEPAWLMVKKTPGLKENFGVGLGGTDTNPGPMYQLSTASRFEMVVGNPGDGANPHGWILDEYHEAKTPDQYDTAKTGMGSRTQPMLWIVTTAGTNTASPCYDKYNQIRDILSGIKENETIWGVVYEIDEGDDWTDFNVWKKANPGYGISVYPDYLKAQYNDAMQNANQQNSILCKNLNKWMNVGISWMNMQKWGKCENRKLNLDDLVGQPCFAAIDLASKIDICARVLLFPPMFEGDKYKAFGRYYLPSETIWKPENSQYQKWVNEGLLDETDGAVTDYRVIERDIKSDHEKYPIQELAYDPREASYLIQNIDEWASFPCIEVTQGPAHISEPMKELEGLVYSGMIEFDGDPIMTWMMSNVIKKQGRGGGEVKAYYPTKQRVGSKIDGIVCIIMALMRAKEFDPNVGESAYDGLSIEEIREAMF